MKKYNTISIIVLSALVILGFAIYAWAKPLDTYSMSERRNLTQKPELTMDSLVSGKFMSDFEDYSVDQFPLRDLFRSVKAEISKVLFRQKDNHGLYEVNGYLSKMEYPENTTRIQTSINKLNDVQQLMKGTACKVYLSIIPDKNCFLAPEGGYLSMDYEALIEKISSSVNCNQYISITDLVSLEDFYYTDQHWKQEKILDIAQRLAEVMTGSSQKIQDGSFEEVELETPFYGTYAGQSALSVEPDTLRYLINPVLRSCRVTSYSTGTPQTASLYNLEKASGRDPYEMFLEGAEPLLVIENPMAGNRKELVVFRDSFGSSLIPLLVPCYSKITVLDLRYINSNIISRYVRFTNQDVLMIYSTLIFNNTISQ